MSSPGESLPRRSHAPFSCLAAASVSVAMEPPLVYLKKLSVLVWWEVKGRYRNGHNRPKYKALRPPAHFVGGSATVGPDMDGSGRPRLQ